MKKAALILGCVAVLGGAWLVLGAMPRESAVSDDSPAYQVALSQAIRALDGVTRSTLNPTRVGEAQAQGTYTLQPGGPTCDGTITCQAWPTYVPVTCETNDPECNYPGLITQNPLKCNPTAPTWDGMHTCHVGAEECTKPTAQMFRTCDARLTCDGTHTCDGSFTHWNSTCDQQGQTCDGSATCGTPAAGGPWTCAHFTVDGTPTCNAVPTCHQTCQQWYTCSASNPTCDPSPNKKTSWGKVKGEYRNR